MLRSTSVILAITLVITSEDIDCSLIIAFDCTPTLLPTTKMQAHNLCSALFGVTC